MANIMRLGGGNSKVKVKNLGTWNINNYKNPTTWNFDVKSKLPNDYDKLTADNFIFPLSKVGHYYLSTSNGEYANITKTYTPSTGKLTLKFSIGGNSSANFIAMTLNVFVILGDIELN